MSRLSFYALCLLLGTVLPVLAADSFEQGIEADGWEVVRGQARLHGDAHDGKRAVVFARRGGDLAKTVQLAPGLYELTVQAKGKGLIQMNATGPAVKTAPRSLRLEDDWGLYGLSFEVAGEGEQAVTFSLGGNQELVLDSVAWTPLSEALRERWRKAMDSYVLLGYYGIDPHRPPPTGQPRPLLELSAENLAKWAIKEKVVYHDPEYDHSWVTDPDRIAEWFVRRGFREQGAEALAKWMDARAEADEAVGTVVLFVMGIVPEAVFPKDWQNSPMGRYLRAGGRVVWLGNVPMYVVQGATGSSGTYGNAVREQFLGLVSDRAAFYGADAPPVLTETAKAWGLEPGPSLVRPVLNRGLDACFVTDPDGKYCGVGMVNMRPEAPLSGFIFLPDHGNPDDPVQMRNVYRLATWSGKAVEIPAPAPLPGEAATIKAEVRFHEHNRRFCFLRGEEVPVYVRLENGEAPVEVTLRCEAGGVVRVDYAGRLEADGDHLLALLNLQGLKVGRYELVGEFRAGDRARRIVREFRISPPPDHQGSHVAIWGNTSEIQRRAEEHLQWLAANGIQPLWVDGVNDLARDLSLWYGFSFAMREHGQAENVVNPPGYDHYRYVASDQIMQMRARDLKRETRGYGSPFFRQAEAEDFGNEMRIHALFPAFRQRAVTGDDYSQWFGMDYNRFIVEGFEARYGIPMPRPEEAMDPTGTPDVARAPGIVPDDEPWLLANRYWSESILGDTATRIADQMRAATDGRGKVGPIPGGMMIPVMQMWASQYPPFNFGPERGWNLLCFYYYNAYWQPPLAHHWWLACARMGNRDMEQWIMPDCYIYGDFPAYYEHSGWQCLSGGATGLEYFMHRPDLAPGAVAAMSHFGGISREQGHLLGAIRPRRRRVGQLICFPQLVYKIATCTSLAYPYFDLLQARVDVEPVAAEELDPIAITRYDAIVVAGTDYLRESTAKLLGDYAANGGKVLIDATSHQAIEVPGATRLELGLGTGGLRGYADLDRIAAVRETMVREVPDACRVGAADPHLVVQPFAGGDQRFYWLIHVQSQQAYLDLWQPTRGRDWTAEQLSQIARGHGYGEKQLITTVTLEGPGIPFDVIGGNPLPVLPAADGMVGAEVTIPYWEGMLVAMLPAIPDGIAVQAPAAVVPGQQVDVNVAVTAAGQVVDGLFPLHLEVRDPDGNANSEYARRILAHGGRGRAGFTFAANDLPGAWTFTVRDAMTRVHRSFEIELQE